MSPIKGQEKSGDSYLVETFASGALVAVIDGLGHGREAAEASRVAYDAIRERPFDSVTAILERCHQRMLGISRGAVITLASLNPKDATLTCAGVGNVEGILFRADPESKPRHETVIPRRGVVGSHMPSLHASAFPIAKGDTLILVTDGIRRGFEGTIRLEQAPQEIADSILKQHALGTDDALVLVVRCGDI